MTRDDIIRMAREADLTDGIELQREIDAVMRFAALVAAAERKKVAQWMIQRSYATGHGDTKEDLLRELDWQIAENWTRAMVKGVETEREACAKVCEAVSAKARYGLAVEAADCAEAIRARGQG